MAKKKKKQTKARKKKVFSLVWAFAPFEEDPSFWARNMFGGFAAYCHGKMVMLLAENPGDREWKNLKFSYDIWNGILFPTSREFHDKILKDYPSLKSHPILRKWLYLPMSDKNFESIAESISEQIAGNDPRFGIFPKEKSRKKKAKPKKIKK